MKIILQRKPKEYLKQGLSYCGGYQIKGILSAFGKGNRDPKDYASFFGISTGNFIIRRLREHGLNASVESAKGFTDKKKLEILKKYLQKGFPVILRIGNGYMPNGKFNLLQALIIGHWISVWGFDDKKGIFYLYDSAAPVKDWKRNLPIGNVVRSYESVLRDWRLGGRFGFGIRKYNYIAVQNI